MKYSELQQLADQFLRKRTNQKDNLVISRSEAISALTDFAVSLNVLTISDKVELDLSSFEQIQANTDYKLGKILRDNDILMKVVEFTKCSDCHYDDLDCDHITCLSMDRSTGDAIMYKRF